jgi:hypothetical protein
MYAKVQMINVWPGACRHEDVGKELLRTQKGKIFPSPQHSNRLLCPLMFSQLTGPSNNLRE